MQDQYEVLYRYFGYTAFRSGQAELIDAQLSGRDVFGIMPTGGGKSLCYQIPALMLEGITLVVSPLISLMKDQVTALKNMGVSAAYVNRSLSAEQIRLVLRNIQQKKYKIIYIAPERLLTESFLAAISNLKIAMVAVDEAHCISQWGQDFRPSYLRIADFLKLLKVRPVVSAFTATATQEVRDDVERILGLQNPLRIITGYDRPNLRFAVVQPKSKPLALLDFIEARPGKCGIVYCSTRKEVEKVCQMLQNKGISATRYHAGLSEEERHTNQDDFVYDRCKVMVATNAFGMGIDKSNVGYVIHYNMPQCIESYYQEAGRAGRDGENADCILLYSPSDIRTAKFLIQHPTENEELSEEERSNLVKKALIRLDAMVGYCNTSHCLRGYILEYFGQEHPQLCGNCSNCESTAEQRDITEYAKMILSCIYRIHEQLGYSLGITLVVRVLHGSREKRIKELRLDRLSTYGLMNHVPRAEIREMISALENQGYIMTHPDRGDLNLTDKAREVLFHGEKVKMLVRKKKREKSRKEDASSNPNTAGLLEELKALRLTLAKEENMPAYIVFSNATLKDMAQKAPVTMAEFLAVSGVGKFKAERYGQRFLTAIKKYMDGGFDSGI
ncbi:MAG: DNA helicase RecQ [Oscillospiraceae bacterium]|nr:DNA helicase RecQ [Oscillospiraceae bacterium]